MLHGVKTNFLLREFRCRDGSDEVLPDSGLLEILQRVRDHFGKAETYLVKGQTVTTVRYNDRNEYVRLLQGEPGKVHLNHILICYCSL